MRGCQRDRMEKGRLRTKLWPSLTLAAFLIGWAVGLLFPIELWDGWSCHRLGGSLQAADGPGKPTQCVIPWDVR